MKFKVAYRYRLKQDLQFLGIVILVEIALGMLGIVLQSLTTPVTMTSLTNRLQQAHPDFYFVVAIFAMGALVYQGYSLFMQNGLSRRTYWLSKVASLSTIALLASLIAVMYRAFVAIPLGATSYAAVGKTLFGSAAGSGNSTTVMAVGPFIKRAVTGYGRWNGVWLRDEFVCLAGKNGSHGCGRCHGSCDVNTVSQSDDWHRYLLHGHLGGTNRSVDVWFSRNPRNAVSGEFDRDKFSFCRPWSCD
ncbi:ABC transporter permease [Furfurilactobacillus entadae]|uniref:hypothetical protein n=1 Tax=Furfurilactobacillus entadae TaxID=2922307 RepID=UPI0038B40707